MLLLVSTMLAGCGAGGSGPPAGTVREEVAAVAPPADPTPPVVNPRDEKLSPGRLRALRVTTAERGWTVLIDGVEVTTAEGKPLVTPCVVQLPEGEYQVTVSRSGMADQLQRALVPEFDELPFDSGQPVPEGQIPSVAAPLRSLGVGESTPLVSLNSPALESDPFVTADGRTMAFVVERVDGRVISVATRPGPEHHFEAPRPIVLTRGSSGDWPACPSLTEDGRTLAYLIPRRSRVWGLHREDAGDEFADRQPLVFDDQLRSTWGSAQISGDGLRVYWTVESGQELAGFAATRKGLDRAFGKPLPFQLPGRHPCLSPDLLRQYTFDGRVVRRARRGSLRQEFGEPETIAEVELPTPLAEDSARSWWVTADEQWLFWAGQSESADLFVTRLSVGPGWGRSWHGEPLVEKPMVAVVEEKPIDTPPPIDPRTLPLPYTQHWRELEKLIAGRQFPAARKLVRSALEQPELAAQRELLQWDLAAVDLVRDFWAGVQESLAKLQPGDVVPYGTTKVEFVRFDDQTLVLKTKTAELMKPLGELPPAEVVELYLLSRPEPTPDDALRIGGYLSFTPRRYDKPTVSRLDAAGADGSRFREAWFLRLVRQAEGEFDRGNVAEGIARLDEVVGQGVGTAARDTAATLKAGLYERTAWEFRGNRKWTRDKDGELRAEVGRFERSYAVSPETYGNFELTCEWQVTGATGQGGVYFRYPGEGELFKNSFKIQLAADAGKGVDQYSTGSLFGYEAPTTNVSKPAGQWNTLKLRVVGEDVTISINDVAVLKTKAVSETVPAQGQILLDGVPGGVAYRKVLIVPVK